MNQKDLSLTQYVYLVGSKKHGWYKIGITHDLRARVKAIQNGLPFKIELFGHVSSRHGEIVEKESHTRFSSQWVRGEWFKDLDIQEVLAYMTTRAEELPHD